MGQKSRTTKLWFVYMEYIEVVKMFIRAEYRGDWIQRLVGTEKMLNLFAVEVHVHYAKPAWLCLQLINCLNEDYINNLPKIAITSLEG